MALIGNCTTYDITYHKTETEEVIISYPDNSDLFGDDAGTTVTNNVPKEIKTPTSYENVYLAIRFINNLNTWIPVEEGDTIKIKEFHIHYAIYTDAATRDLDPTDFLYEDVIALNDLDLSQGLYKQAYNRISQIEGLTDLTSD
jgi:hypothetical protein